MPQISESRSIDPELVDLLNQAKDVPVTPEMIMSQRLAIVLSMNLHIDESPEDRLKRIYDDYPEFSIFRDYLELKKKLAKIQSILDPSKSSGV